MALILDIDPIRLSRRRGHAHVTHALEPYVNDRPYVASSHLSVAISKVLGTALSGMCKTKPELVDMPLELTMTLPVVPCRGNGTFITSLFEPLGYQVKKHQPPLDDAFPQWGMSRCWHVELKTTQRLTDVLSHLYVMIPVLDDDKHYYISRDEVEKLLRHGQGWLPEHPEQEHITKRYLERRGTLVRGALEQLRRLTNHTTDEEPSAQHDAQEHAIEKPLSLHQQRLDFVVETLINKGARRVLDLGCGEGKLIKKLLKHAQFEHILGIDVVHRALQIASRRLKLDHMSAQKRARITLKPVSYTHLTLPTTPYV